MRRLTTIGLILCGALLAAAAASASAKPVVPRTVQLRILHATPALAYAPTRTAFGFHYVSWQKSPSNVEITLRQQGGLGDPLHRAADERIVPDRDGEELPARRQQGLLVAHRRRADGLALRHRPVRAGRCGSSRRARSRRPSSRTSASAASSRRASGSPQLTARVAAAHARRSAEPGRQADSLSPLHLSRSHAVEHHASTSSNRRPATTPNSSSRVSFARVVAGLVIPQRKRAR